MSENVGRGTASLTADSKKSSKCTWYYGFHLKVRLVFDAITVNDNIKGTGEFLYDRTAVFKYIKQSLPGLNLERQVVRYRAGKTPQIIYLRKVSGQITEAEKHHIAEELRRDADKLRRVMGIRADKNAKWYEELNIDRNNDADSSSDDEWSSEVDLEAI
ncbi:hypothetical protein ACEPAI_2686 [Sanghuangporus weigelae]